MINSVNERDLGIGIDAETGKVRPFAGLTIEERKAILNRALYAVPFFIPATIPIADFATGLNIFKTRVHINIDFWLTEVRMNVASATAQKGSNFNISIYESDTGQSVYGYNRGDKIPATMVGHDTGFDIFSVIKYDDRQKEFIPRFIPHGTEVIIEVQSDTAVANAGDFQLCLCGFNGITYPYLGSDETQKINNSLDRITIFQEFKIKLNADDYHNRAIGETIFFNIENDNIPRLSLGFGIVDNPINEGSSSLQALISIFDSTRHVNITDSPTFAECIAPRVAGQLSVVKDTHMYYLPIEHYFMPFGNLHLKIDVPDNQGIIAGNGFELVLLTRTV